MKLTTARYRIIALIVVILLIGSMSACNEENSTKSEADPSVNTEADNTPAVTETEDESSSEITKDSSDNSDDEMEADLEEFGADDDLTETQKNSINMLNYMTVLTERVNGAKGDQLLLESTYKSLVNDLNPNAVDRDTQSQIKNLMDAINDYRMILVKRKRLQYIHEQNQAQALRQAIPNPVGLLSAVESGNLLKSAASVLYMNVDSISSYKSATSQADLQFIKEGWELDDEEAAKLHNSTKDELDYMFDMVRNYDLPGDYALNAEAVTDFVSWSSKPDEDLTSKIEWLKTHEDTYQRFGPYWLELAKNYYNAGDFNMCLDAIHHYEAIFTRIFRKDKDYATALPLAIVSARETMSESDYVAVAAAYCEVILKNTKDSAWDLRYFAAQTYLDLYKITAKKDYIDKAYEIAKDNVNVLKDSQRISNEAYLAPISEEKADKDASKREKKEIKAYNKLMKKEREIALPPVNEALYLNCDLLLAVAKEKGLSDEEQKTIEGILHNGSDKLFLTNVVDNRFHFTAPQGEYDSNKIDIEFDGEVLKLPAACLTERCTVSATVSGAKGKTKLKDWKIEGVSRPQSSKKVADFTATFVSKKGKKHKYKKGDKITIEVVPVELSPEEKLVFKYKVKQTKKALLFKGIKFERVKK